MLTSKNGQIVLLALFVMGCLLAGYTYRHKQARQQAVLGRFATVTADLAAANQQSAQANAATMRAESRIVSLNHYYGPDLHVLRTSERIWNRAHSLTDTLRAIRQLLGSAHHTDQHLSQGRLANDWYARLDGQLSRYAAFIQQATPGTAPKTATIWPTANWLPQATPLPVTLAILTQLETQVRQDETKALQVQAEKIGSKCWICWRIEARAVATATTVAPGAMYEAQLLLTETPVADFGSLTLSANGTLLRAKPEARAQVELPIAPWHPGQPDTVRAQWHGTIRAHSYPADSTWQLDVPYLIVKRPAL